uniref:Uncharacterized protein n=1 Tax=Glossina pallidipes TaxID=7398 RepID=A0A1B0AEV2_GLOPL
MDLMNQANQKHFHTSEPSRSADVQRLDQLCRDQAHLQFTAYPKFIINYVGRPCAAAPATGNKNQFDRELNSLITDIFGELTEEDKEFIKATAEEARAKAQEAAKANAAKAKAQRAAKADATKAEAQETAKADPAKAKPEEGVKADAAKAKPEESVKADAAKAKPQEVSKADAAKGKPQEPLPKPPNEGIPPSATPAGSPPMKTSTPQEQSTSPGSGKSHGDSVSKPDPSAPDSTPPKTDDSSPSKPGTPPAKK